MTGKKSRLTGRRVGLSLRKHKNGPQNGACSMRFLRESRPANPAMMIKFAGNPTLRRIGKQPQYPRFR
jgi:hypothetical protein